MQARLSARQAVRHGAVLEEDSDAGVEDSGGGAAGLGGGVEDSGGGAAGLGGGVVGYANSGAEGCESDVVGCANSGGAVDCESDRIGHARSARHGERGCETATDRVGPLLVPAACRAA